MGYWLRSGGLWGGGRRRLKAVNITSALGGTADSMGGGGEEWHGDTSAPHTPRCKLTLSTQIAVRLCRVRVLRHFWILVISVFFTSFFLFIVTSVKWLWTVNSVLCCFLYCERLFVRSCFPMVVLESGGIMNPGSNQYLQPDYLSPLPTTVRVSFIQNFSC